jgi:replicative DNA helicase
MERNFKPKKIEFKIEGLPPIHSPEAERAVLGAMLAEPIQCVDEAAEALVAEDFFQPAHQTLFREMNQMRNAGQAIDPATLLQWLADRRLADTVGGPELMGELSASVVSVLTFPAHLETVRTKSLLRHLQTVCAAGAYNAHERQHEAAQVIDETERAMFAIGNRESGHGLVSAKQGVLGATELVERAMRLKGKVDGITTGLREVDELTTGFKPGDMVVIAARPGVGKTALALGITRHLISERFDEQRERLVQPGWPVGFFSLEMTAEQLMLRLLAALTGIDLQKLRQGRLSPYELDRFAQTAEQLSEWPLHVDESSFLTIMQLRAKARRMKQRFGVAAIVIDYLQLLTGQSRNSDNRQVEVAEISRGIKGIAKELKVPVLVLSQLNRKPEEGGHEPALHHLRESGSIEQDADVVLLLSREMDGEGDTGTATVNVAKQRNGPTDKIRVEFVKKLARFQNQTRDAR